MNLLLDTHIALWAIGDNPNLPQKAKELIMYPDNLLPKNGDCFFLEILGVDQRSSKRSFL